VDYLPQQDPVLGDVLDPHVFDNQYVTVENRRFATLIIHFFRLR
jgi:hypothetical protein